MLGRTIEETKSDPRTHTAQCVRIALGTCWGVLVCSGRPDSLAKDIAWPPKPSQREVQCERARWELGMCVGRSCRIALLCCNVCWCVCLLVCLLASFFICLFICLCVRLLVVVFVRLRCLALFVLTQYILMCRRPFTYPLKSIPCSKHLCERPFTLHTKDRTWLLEKHSFFAMFCNLKSMDLSCFFNT